MGALDLTTFCGGSCGTCARSSQHTAFREAAAFDYAEFRKGLDFFADPESWLVCTKGCRNGDGGPPFCVRECCREHGVDLCFDCADFPCEKTTAFADMVSAAEDYRQLGRAEWLRRQSENRAV